MVGFQRPELLALLLIALPGIYVALKARSRMNRIVGISRFVMIVLLVTASAGLYIDGTKAVSEQPQVTVLVDSSRSAELLDDYELDLGEVNVRKKVIASGNSSDIRHGMLRNLEPNTNYLAVSDFQSSSSLDDVPEKFRSVNSTLNALRLGMEKEASVSIRGPSRTVAGAKNIYTVKVSSTAETPSPTAFLDNEEVDLAQTGETTWQFSRRFTDNGTHAIRAEIEYQDRFDENNRYFKEVQVVKKPRILVVGDKGVFGQKMEQFYKIDYANSVPSDLEEYYAVILKKQPEQPLHQFVSLGNGVVFMGDLEKQMDILPVFPVPEDEQNKGAKIVMAIDISVSTAEEGKVKKSKQIAYTLAELLPFNNKLGAVAYNRYAYVIDEPKPLAFNREELKQKIASLEPSGPSFHNNGIQGARELLNGTGNIILISDGKIGGLGRNSGVEEDSKRLASELDVDLITVSVGGDSNTEFLQELADLAGGMFLDAESADRLQFVFNAGGASGSSESLVVIDRGHFITRGLDPSAQVTLLDSVEAKKGADLLVTTTTGRPFLTSWNYGLGRVAVMSADTANLKNILEESPSLVTRPVSWAVGDPQRKEEKWMRVESGQRGEVVEVKASYPVEGLRRAGENLYVGELYPERTGFHSFKDLLYAYNYNDEIRDVGYGEMESVVERAGGKIYERGETDRMAEDITQFSRREVETKKSLSDYLIIAVMILFLLEIGYRKMGGAK